MKKVFALVLCLASLAHAADGLPANASTATADAQRGRKLLLNRQETGCVLCHVVSGLQDGGDIGPSLVGVGQRMSPEALRQRIADPRLLNPQTIMPAYFSSKGLHNVAKAFRGKTILTEQGLEDIMAYLLQPPSQ
jgi:L-cysteine S-thiosulfotransferase